MKFDNQLRHATHIVTTYRGEAPLHAWLKDFFRLNKQMGSRDRKLLSQLSYGFYRLGHTLKDLHPGQRILAGLFLCSDEPSEFLQYFKPDWNEMVAHPLDEKISLVQAAGLDFRLTDLFPWKEELSADIDHEAFCRSFLRQPDLFLRIRPDFKETVLKKLDQSALAGKYQLIPPFTLRLPNGFRIEELFTPDKEIVIQDYSSQRIAEYLQLPSPPVSFWDACAASGGKSILAHDLYPGLNIIVSDIRGSILQNLKQRFANAGIRDYHSFVADLALTFPPDDKANADLILADVPCSGSGTWSRTPEELYFFHPRKISVYSELQQKIISHIIPCLFPDTHLVYTTCSVFKKENEEIAALIRDSFHLKEEIKNSIKGYDQHADSMYAARFSYPS